MKPIEKMPTDVPGLDTLLFGGVPRGRSTLITGRSGTAKSVLALQLAAAFAKRGTKTLLLSVEEAPADLITTAASLDFDLERHIEAGTLTIHDMGRPTDGTTVYTGNFDVSGLVHTIERVTQEHGIEAVVLDSATALFSPRPQPELMRTVFHQLVAALRRLGVTSIITAEALEDYGQLTVLGVEDFVCDLVITLRNHVDAERRRRSLEVHKYRRSRHFKGEYPFTITLNGLVVFPLDAVGLAADVPDEGRFSSGVDGLDRMTNGGWLRDSIVLVRGPTGSGKTTLAGLYARAGAMRGEKVIYYGFEETRRLLLRNFAAMDMPLERHESDGTLKIRCSYPEATSPEDLLVEVRAGIQEHKPSLIVFDSLSSIMHSTSERGFRHFMVGLAALLREHSRSALLTETIVTGTEADVNAPFLSTIPDAILCLDYALRDDELKRSIRILKMRGSAHETGRKELSMQAGGLVVSPEKDGAADR